MRNYVYTSLFILFCFLNLNFTSTEQDISDSIVKSISSGNAKELAKFFSSNIDLTLPDFEGMYSQNQAEIIVKEFFAKNPPKKFTVIHKGASKDNSQFTIGKLETEKNKFRVMFLLKKVGEKFQIHQLRFEPEV